VILGHVEANLDLFSTGDAVRRSPLVAITCSPVSRFEQA